jgi:hypothetical protein
MAADIDDTTAAVERPFQDHFVMAYHRVIDDKRIGKLGLAAYIALARFADFNTKSTQVRRVKLAAVARLSVRGLDAGVDELVGAGYVAVERVKNPDGSWAPCRYQLLDTALAQVAVSAGGGAHGAPGGSAHDAPPPAPPAGGVVQDLHEGGAHGAHQEQETSNKRLLNENAAELPLGAAPATPADLKQSFNRRAQAITRRYVDLVPLSKFPAILGIVKKALNANYADDMVGAALERLAVDGRPVTVDTLRIELDGLTPARVAAANGGPTRTEQRVAAGMDVARQMREAANR